MAVQLVSQSLSSQLIEFKSTLLLSLPAGLDYAAISGMVLTFTPSVTEISISIAITNDELVEIDENFFGVLTTNSDRVTVDPAEAEVIIVANDSKFLKLYHSSVTV